MNDAEAEAYVERAIAWFARGRPSDALTVGLSSVPAVTRALERRGWLVRPGEGPGRLWLAPPEPPDPERARALGEDLLRSVRARTMDNRQAAAALGGSAAEVAFLRQRRFEEIGHIRLAEMTHRLGASTGRVAG